MKRTSLTHPLQIAAVTAGPKFGRVGITFCPGQYDRHAMGGYQDRDLALDLDTVHDWGAAAVVTLLERKELTLLRVERLGVWQVRRIFDYLFLRAEEKILGSRRAKRVVLGSQPMAGRKGNG